MGNAVIKDAAIEDFDVAFEIIEKLWTYNDYDKETIRKVYKEVLDNPTDFAYFLMLGDEYIGFCHGTFFNTFWLSGQTCYVSSIYTDEEYRRQGYAHQLMDHAKVLATEKDCSAIVLDSGFPRKPAHAFYEKYGFEKSAYCFEFLLKEH